MKRWGLRLRRGLVAVFFSVGLGACFASGGGEESTAETAEVSHVPLFALADVSGFSLIDADADVPIAGFDPIAPGAVLNLAALPTRNLNLRANVADDTGSVQFGFDGAADYAVENVPPFALAGDRGGDYNPWTPSLGSHTVTATPFAGEGASGGPAGAASTLSFTVIDEVAPLPSDAVPIPALIEAEDFVAFYDTTENHSGDCGDGPVDQQVTRDPLGGTCNIGWTAAGEWLEYDVISSGGTFDLELRLAAKNAGKVVRVEVDQIVVGEVESPSDGWQAFATRSVPVGALAAGVHTVRLVFVDGSTNLNWLEFVDASVPPPEDGCTIAGTLVPWHRVVLDCRGPQTSESSATNPFTDYRMQVVFESDGARFEVPGHFAADGNAANTGAQSGSVWRAYFMPPTSGSWTYRVGFTSGKDVAIAGGGAPVPTIDGARGQFDVGAPVEPTRDLRTRGLLQHFDGERYLRFTQTGKVFIEGGVDSPENLLAYADFDNTVDCPGDNSGVLHEYPTHAGDWNAGDPTWRDGKGKALIGAINYLATTGVNAQYLLTMTREHDGKGDDNRIVPWTSCDERERFDVSKLDQWELVFEHLNRKGLMIHLLTQETENDQLLDGGALGRERKLYYRELISRFGHHPALQWNLGEENTNTAAQVKSYSDFFASNDAYGHAVVMHTYPGQKDRYVPLLGHATFDGPTLQFGAIPDDPVGGLYGETRTWIERSLAAGVAWVVTATEASGAQAPRPGEPVTARQRIYWMWANAMAGGGGFEWYLKGTSGGGHAFDHALEDFRDFDPLWRQSGHVVRFFRDVVQRGAIDLELMQPDNGRTAASTDWVLAQPGAGYLIFLREGGAVDLDLSDEGGPFQVDWFDPRSGALTTGASVEGGARRSIGAPPRSPGKDWVVWVHR